MTSELKLKQHTINTYPEENAISQNQIHVMDAHKRKMVPQNIILVTIFMIFINHCSSTFFDASGVEQMETVAEEAEDHLVYPSPNDWYP